MSGYGRFTDRRAPRRGRYTSLYVHGYRSASPIPILWAFAVIAGGVALLLIVLTLTHMGSAATPANTTVVTSTVAPAQPTTPPQPCFPFQTTC
ncbi:hypothetical protein ACWDUL_39905 [Nocardia niigatensis]|uniref:hypothetical protein n=1 Tax=Nocardia niigatensis TaxID=209249 RepID=UPI00031D9FA7|nr:hypothetical protein [Nocardia niigatensis]